MERNTSRVSIDMQHDEEASTDELRTASIDNVGNYMCNGSDLVLCVAFLEDGTKPGYSWVDVFDGRMECMDYLHLDEDFYLVDVEIKVTRV